jgi:hypothetical protein
MIEDVQREQRTDVKWLALVIGSCHDVAEHFLRRSSTAQIKLVNPICTIHVYSAVCPVVCPTRKIIASSAAICFNSSLSFQEVSLASSNESVSRGSYCASSYVYTVIVNLNFAESGRGVCTYVPKGFVLLLMMTQPAKYNIKQLHVQPHSRVFSK